MGFLNSLFRRIRPKPVIQNGLHYSAADMQMIGDIGRRQVEIVNESLEIAVASQNLETKLSRLEVAKLTVGKTKELAAQYPFLRLVSLDEVECTITQLEFQFRVAGYKEIADANSRAQSLEESGQHAEALIEYESLLQRGVDTPITYRRLAILYRKAKNNSEEVRVLRCALQNVPRANITHYTWFEDRLHKIADTKRSRRSPPRTGQQTH